jgi:hypothetical protein
MIRTTNNKWLALKAFINGIWLKDQNYYCNYCGRDYVKGEPSCCENPQIGRNIDHCRGLIKQNKEIQNSRLRETASNETKTMRWGISIPPRLYHDAEQYFKKQHNEKLFNDNKELRAFMKEFKCFTIPSKI